MIHFGILGLVVGVVALEMWFFDNHWPGVHKRRLDQLFVFAVVLELGVNVLLLGSKRSIAIYLAAGIVTAIIAWYIYTYVIVISAFWGW